MQNNYSNQELTYAGFWVRLAAYCLDSILVFLHTVQGTPPFFLSFGVPAVFVFSAKIRESDCQKKDSCQKYKNEAAFRRSGPSRIQFPDPFIRFQEVQS